MKVRRDDKGNFELTITMTPDEFTSLHKSRAGLFRELLLIEDIGKDLRDSLYGLVSVLKQLTPDEEHFDKMVD